MTATSPSRPRRCRAARRSDDELTALVDDGNATLGADPSTTPPPTRSSRGRRATSTAASPSPARWRTPCCRTSSRGSRPASTCSSSTPATTSPRRSCTRDDVAERPRRHASSTCCPSRPSPSRTPSTARSLYDRDPALCCQMRKVEPLSADPRRLRGVGHRRAPRGGARPAPTPRSSTWDDAERPGQGQPARGVDLRRRRSTTPATHQVPVNLLLSDGYPSIGCEPCTRRVAPGEDPRAGRWAGFAKTECGLHT